MKHENKKLNIVRFTGMIMFNDNNFIKREREKKEVEEDRKLN